MERSQLAAGDVTRPFAVIPKLDLNRAYYNADSVRYFAGEALTVRGEVVGGPSFGRVFRYSANEHGSPTTARQWRVVRASMLAEVRVMRLRARGIGGRPAGRPPDPRARRCAARQR